MPASTAMIANRFDQTLVEANGLGRNGFERWLFQPGMGFKAPRKWWGDLGPRDFPHEGVDFCLYRTSSGQTGCLDENSRIPALADGVVRGVFKDFLGRAIIVEHRGFPGTSDRPLLSVYAHTTPRSSLAIGTAVRQGEVIATIAGTGHPKSGIRPHLHFTLARPERPLPYDAFFWNIMRDPAQVTLLDPGPYFNAPLDSLIADGPQL